jgi:glutaredoxin
MIILYTSPVCPYCKKVEAYMHEAGIVYEERSIVEPAYRDELIQKGGKMQVPFLVDTDQDVAMYESDDMIAHLSTHA